MVALGAEVVTAPPNRPHCTPALTISDRSAWPSISNAVTEPPTSPLAADDCAGSRAGVTGRGQLPAPVGDPARAACGIVSGRGPAAELGVEDLVRVARARAAQRPSRTLRGDGVRGARRARGQWCVVTASSVEVAGRRTGRRQARSVRWRGQLVAGHRLSARRATGRRPPGPARPRRGPTAPAAAVSRPRLGQRSAMIERRLVAADRGWSDRCTGSSPAGRSSSGIGHDEPVDLRVGSTSAR